MAGELRGRGRGGFVGINITPLVDVMLVLLVVFMVTAPLLTTGLRIDLPEVKAANTPVKDARLLVSVTKDERILFGETDVTKNIEYALRANERVQSQSELYIRADKNAHYGVVARVVAAARAANVRSLNLLVEPEVEEVPEEQLPSPPSGQAPAPAPARAGGSPHQ